MWDVSLMYQAWARDYDALYADSLGRAEEVLIEEWLATRDLRGRMLDLDCGKV